MMYPVSSAMTGVRPSSILLLVLLVGEAVALGQIGGGQYPGGQYPGGQYPGGQYPGGQNPNGNRLPGAGLPFPGRKKKKHHHIQRHHPEQFTYVNGLSPLARRKQVVVQAEDTRILNVKSRPQQNI